MAKAIHSMIRVLDEARSRDFYKRAFGLEVADRLDFEKFTLVYMSNGKSPFEVELTVNKGRTEPYDLGDGYGHLAVLVEDLEAEHARFEADLGKGWAGQVVVVAGPEPEHLRRPESARSRPSRAQPRPVARQPEHGLDRRVQPRDRH